MQRKLRKTFNQSKKQKKKQKQEDSEGTKNLSVTENESDRYTTTNVNQKLKEAAITVVNAVKHLRVASVEYFLRGI